MTDADILRLCIDRVSRTKHASGAWQATLSCARNLARIRAPHGDVYRGNILIDADCALAAKRIGLWLRTVTKETPC
jgi:hypothetical protein